MQNSRFLENKQVGENMKINENEILERDMFKNIAIDYRCPVECKKCYKEAWDVVFLSINAGEIIYICDKCVKKLGEWK